MYRFSRAIYRELEHEILEDHPLQGGPIEPRARPARLRERRRPPGHRQALLRPADQDAVQRHPDLLPDGVPAPRLLRRGPLHELRAASTSRRARATGSTSRATGSSAARPRAGAPPCQRVPLAHNGYCPSHQHLAETGRGRAGRLIRPRTVGSRPRAAGSRRRRDVHGRRGGRRRPAGHGQGADHARRPVRGRAGRRRGRARARRRGARTTSRRSPTGRPWRPTRCSRARARAPRSSPPRASRTSSSWAARRAPTSTASARRIPRRWSRPSAGSAPRSGWAPTAR